MRYAIFGCTADPFTEAHQAIVSELLTQGLADHVIIAPTIVDYHRQGKKPWLNDDQKIDIINIRLSNDEGIRSLPSRTTRYWSIWDEDFKIRNICSMSNELYDNYVKSHRFIDTLLSIIKRYDAGITNEDQHGNEYSVVIGTDSYRNFKTWHMWESILKLAKLIVVDGRNGFGLPADGPSCTVMKIDSKFANVSATEIRNLWRDVGFDGYKVFVESSFVKKQEDELLLHTPIFDVVKGEKTASGLNPIKINAPNWVSIIVEKDKMFLVEKQFRYGANGFVEEFPCGMVEKGEDPLDAVVREVEEETGIRILDKTQVVKLGQTNPNPAFMTNKMHYYYVNLDNAEYVQVDQHLDEHEELELNWKDKRKFMLDLADAAYACGKKQVPAIALAMVKLYENACNYPNHG